MSRSGKSASEEAAKEDREEDRAWLGLGRVRGCGKEAEVRGGHSGCLCEGGVKGANGIGSRPSVPSAYEDWKPFHFFKIG